MNKRVKLSLSFIGIGLSLLITGCATQENQQIIMANMAALNADRAAEKEFAESLNKVKNNPAAVVALSLNHAYHKAPARQRVETVRSYLGTLGDLALGVLPFVHSSRKNSHSGNVSAGRDVYISSSKGDVNTAGQGIESGIKRDGNGHTVSQPTVTVEETNITEDVE